MVSIQSHIRSFLAKKPGFWFFQITGWILFYIQQYLQYYNELKSFQVTVRWTISMLFLFCITLFLRRVFRYIYIRRKSYYLIAISVLFFSLIAAILWLLFNSYLLKGILEFLTGWQVEVFIPFDIAAFLNRTSFLAFPIVIWSLLYFGIKLWLDLMKEKDRSEKSVLLAQTAQLRMLRYQLNPHFLFNSLSSIQALIYDDPKHADLMLTELSDFLRFTLHDKEKLYIPLRDEVVIIQKYLSMEKRRFPDRLNYSVTFTEEAAKQEVVAFILQPFVENAVKYGMRTSPENLLIDIKGFIQDKRLVLEIMNSGKWIEQESNEGTGIRNVIERLQNAYTDKYKIFIDKGFDSVTVSIEISIK